MKKSDLEKVKQLREATGAGFKDCNLAVKESGGDLDKAVEILRVKGISKASKKMSRDAKEGVIATSGDENKISVIEINCETDFVAKNDDFVSFAKELSELNNQNSSDLEKLKVFVHRTFNGEDFIQFIISLKHIYKAHNGLESIFSKYAKKDSLQFSIHEFKKHFFEVLHLPRTQKHISDPLKNSAAKRINMYLRWMIRNDKTGVDFGIWKSLSPSLLSCPLDVHSGNVARKLGLLNRKQNDAKALNELDISLRQFDVHDPVKYDFALFGLGVFEGF